VQNTELKTIYKYNVNKVATLPDFEDWAKTGRAEIKEFTWTEHSFYPETTARLLYCNSRLYLRFDCREKYIHATRTKHLSQVWKDNCVEFFVSPSHDLTKPYFNFEFNALGFIQLSSRFMAPDREKVAIEDIETIECKTKIKEPVIDQDETIKEWYLEAAIPFSLIKKYADVERPGPGTVWRANFNKCAEDTKEPHWATWAPIDSPTPSFHKPEFFGQLVFE
jgi:Carbohydrate-binding family 9